MTFFLFHFICLFYVYIHSYYSLFLILFLFFFLFFLASILFLHCFSVLFFSLLNLMVILLLLSHFVLTVFILVRLVWEVHVTNTICCYQSHVQHPGCCYKANPVKRLILFRCEACKQWSQFLYYCYTMIFTRRDYFRQKRTVIPYSPV